MDKDKTIGFPGSHQLSEIVNAPEESISKAFPEIDKEMLAKLPEVDDGPQEIKLLLRYHPEKQTLNYVILNPINVEDSLRALLRMECCQPATCIKINGVLNHRSKIIGTMSAVDSEVLKELLNDGWEF